MIEMDCGKASGTEKEFHSVTVSVTIYNSGLVASVFLSLVIINITQAPRIKQMKRKVKAAASGAGPSTVCTMIAVSRTRVTRATARFNSVCCRTGLMYQDV